MVSFAAETSVADSGGPAGWELDCRVAEAILPQCWDCTDSMRPWRSLCCEASGKVWFHRGLKLSEWMVLSVFNSWCKKRSKADNLQHSVVCGAWQRDQWELWSTTVSLSKGHPEQGMHGISLAGVHSPDAVWGISSCWWCWGILVLQGSLMVTSESPKAVFSSFLWYLASGFVWALMHWRLDTSRTGCRWRKAVVVCWL